MRDLRSRNYQGEKNDEELRVAETTACKQSEEGDAYWDEKKIDNVEILYSSHYRNQNEK